MYGHAKCLKRNNMNIYDFFGRFTSEVIGDHIEIVSYNRERRQRRLFCNVYGSILPGGTTSLGRILNRTQRRCNVFSDNHTISIEWADNDLELKIDNTVVATVKREPLREIDDFNDSEAVDLQIEIATVLKNIAREGCLPQKYSTPRQERPATEEGTPVKKTSQPMVDDIPEDVFNNESIVEKIKKCGEVYGNSRKLPVIIRFNDKKLMITDTAIEDDFLYLDVVEIPKKEFKPSFKFSDYLKFDYDEFLDGINHEASIAQALNAEAITSVNNDSGLRYEAPTMNIA